MHREHGFRVLCFLRICVNERHLQMARHSATGSAGSTAFHKPTSRPQIRELMGELQPRASQKRADAVRGTPATTFAAFAKSGQPSDSTPVQRPRFIGIIGDRIASGICLCRFSAPSSSLLCGGPLRCQWLYRKQSSGRGDLACVYSRCSYRLRWDWSCPPDAAHIIGFHHGRCR